MTVSSTAGLVSRSRSIWSFVILSKSLAWMRSDFGRDNSISKNLASLEYDMDAIRCDSVRLAKAK